MKYFPVLATSLLQWNF